MSSIDKGEGHAQQANNEARHSAAAIKSGDAAKPLGMEPADSKKNTLHITTKYISGMELLIQDKKLELEHCFTIDPKSEPMTMRDLIKYVGATHVLKDMQEAFTRGGTICPGIMVIINESDWEVMDELEYKLKNNDIVEFISTLHGG
ncbi:Ubiquitin- modifier 1 [Coemansia sp. RSA 2424]|nr:Ubiquitin- modifier 1 [Coemansia sp. RSA 2424]